MPDQNFNYMWKDGDGTFLDMRTMDPKHLQAAHTHACVKEYSYHQKTGFFSDLRDQLEEIAENRDILLNYPDETHPSPKWNNYFCAIRKARGITPTVLVRKIPLATYSGLKQVNVFTDKM